MDSNANSRRSFSLRSFGTSPLRLPSQIFKYKQKVLQPNASTDLELNPANKLAEPKEKSVFQEYEEAIQHDSSSQIKQFQRLEKPKYTPILEVDELNPQKSLEVYKLAIACTKIRLTNELEANISNFEKKFEKKHKRNSSVEKYWSKFSSSTSSDNFLNQHKFKAIQEAVEKEIQHLKNDPNADQLYSSALITFDREIDAKIDVVQVIRLTIDDLLAIFSSLSKKMKAPKSNNMVTSTEEENLARFEKLIMNAAKIKQKTTSLLDIKKDEIGEHLANALSIPQKDQTEILESVQRSQTSKSLFFEMSANLYFLNNHPFYNFTSFLNTDMFESWKVNESKEIHALLKKIDESAYQVFEMSEKSKSIITGTSKIRIKVVKARGLTGKDKTGKSDPYCTIEYGKESFETKVINQNLDPVWDEQITLTIKDPKGKITINVWDKDEKSDPVTLKKFFKDETDDFLGTLSFDVEEIINRGYGPLENWFPLQKRSKRSNISGDIYLIIMHIPSESALEMMAADRMTLSFPHHDYFAYLMKALLYFDYKDIKSGVLSDSSIAILQEYACRYRIGDFFQSVVYFALLAELHISSGTDLKLLNQSLKKVAGLFEQKAPCTREERRIFENASFELDQYLRYQLFQYQVCFPFGKPRGSVQYVLKMLQLIYGEPNFQRKRKMDFELKGEDVSRLTDPFIDTILSGLKETSVNNYARYSELCSGDTSVQRLLKLIESVTRSLDDDLDNFEDDFKKEASLSISYFNGKEYFKFLMLELDNELLVVKTQKAIGDFYDWFNLYIKLYDTFEEYFELLSPEGEKEEKDWELLKESFNLSEKFKPVFRQWIEVTDEQFSKWVESAIQTDKFVPISATALQSTSVVDIFSSFNQATRSLKKITLEPAATITLRTELARIICKNVQKYCSMLYTQCSRDIQGEIKNETTFSFFKQKFSRKTVEFSDQQTIALNNIYACRNYLHEVFDVIGVDEVLSLLQKKKEQEKEEEETQSKKIEKRLSVKSMEVSSNSRMGHSFREDQLETRRRGSSLKEISRSSLKETRSSLDGRSLEDQQSNNQRKSLDDRVPNNQKKSLEEQRRKSLDEIESHEGPNLLGQSFGLFRSSKKESTEIQGLTGTLYINIICAENLKACDVNGKSDPYVLLKSNKKILAKTRIINKTLNPKWEEKFGVTISNGSILKIKVYDYDRFSLDDLCGETQFNLNNLRDGYVHDIWLDLTPQGKIHLTFRFDQNNINDIDFHFRFTFQFIKRQLADTMKLFVDQMVPDLKEIINKMIDNAKGKTFLKSNTDVTSQEAQQALAPLLTYLDTHLSSISEKLFTELCTQLISRTWRSILKCYKLAMIPTIDEDIQYTTGIFSSKKNLLMTPRQLSLIEQSLTCLSEFLEAGGEGLEKAVVQNRRFLQMTTIISFFKKSVDELIKRYEKIPDEIKLMREESKSTGLKTSLLKDIKFANEEMEVILQILQLREEREAKKFVDEKQKEIEQERRRTNNEMLQT